MAKLVWVFILIFFLSVLVRAQINEAVNPDDFTNFCGRVFLRKKEKLKLNDMEKTLVCGDEKKDEVGRPWSKIPGNQAEFFLKSFLQSRGYHRPKMKNVAGDLFVSLGPRARAKSFFIKNKPEVWKAPKRRYIKGRVLDPKLLDELEQWSAYQLKMNGYACGTASAMADPETGEIEMTLNSGDRLRIKNVVDTNTTGLREGVMDRYNAFLTGDYYKQRLIDLTERRISEDGVVSTVNLKPKCEPDGVVILRRIDPGPSRQVRIGFGGSTDEGPKIRFNMQQTRIGKTASTAQANADLSIEHRDFSTSFRWYYSHTLVGNFIEPILSYQNTLEPQRKEQIFDATIYHGWGYTFKRNSLTFKIGPDYSENFLLEGFGPRRTTLTVLSGDVDLMDHDWEFFQHSPRQGYNQTIDFLLAQSGVGSSFTADKLRYQGQWLFNLGNFDPPFAILGFRWSVGSTFANQRLTPQLPTRFQFFGGGVGGLRGWQNEALPRSGAAFSEAHIGSELRFYKLIFNILGPFIFSDFGRLGSVNLKFTPPTFFSPGVGLRWESPIGAIRAFVAQPIVWGIPSGEPNYDRSLHLGLTLGEEF